MIYATCFYFDEENEKQVEALFARNSDQKLMPLGYAWPDDVSVPCNGNYMRLTPHQHNTDGFFAAVMERITIDGKEEVQENEEES